MKPVLVHLAPLDKITAQRVAVRVGDAPSAEAYGAPGGPWLPALAVRPQLSIELFSKGLDGRVQTARARFAIRVGRLGGVAVQRLSWRGAPVFIRVDDQLAGQAAAPDFVGHVRDDSYDRDTGILTLQCEVSAARLNGPILTRTFTGGGGINGDPGKRGVFWPAGFGPMKNIEPIWFDETRWIGAIDGYHNTLSIDWLGEGLSSFGPRVADYPNYAALAAAIDNKTIGPGQWGTCVAEGLVGLGAPPVGVITVHAVFGANRIGAMIRRLLLTHAGMDVADIDDASLVSLDQQVNKPVAHWLSSQRNVKDLVEALARSAIATPLITFRGIFAVTRAVSSAAVMKLMLDGSGLPRVMAVRAQSSDAPVSRVSARTAVPARVLTSQEVNYKDTIEDKGDWNAATEYRDGQLVWLPDGSSYLYINAAPSAGHDPRSIPAGQPQDAWWSRQRRALDTTALAYADGTPLEDLKPATPDATAGAPQGTTIGGVIDPETGVVVGGKPAEEVVADQEAQAAALAAANRSFLSAVANAELARLRDRALHFPGPDGASTFTMIVREEKRSSTAQEAMAEVISLLGAVTPDGNAFVFDDTAVFARPDVAGATTYVSVSAEFGEQKGLIEDVRQVLAMDGGVLARSVNQLDVNGRIVGQTTTNDGATGAIVFVIDTFSIETPAGLKLFYADAQDGGRVKLPNVQVNTIEVGAVGVNELSQGSAMKPAWAQLSSDFVIPRGSTLAAFEVQFKKEDNDSALRIGSFLNLKSGDDVQCDLSFQVDGMVMSYQQGINLVFDTNNSMAQLGLTPFIYVSGILAGWRTISIKIYNREVDDKPLSVVAGSGLEIWELRKATLGTLNGSGGALPPPGIGSGSGADGGYDGKFYSPYMNQQ